jgi:microcin C transport system permease protein
MTAYFIRRLLLIIPTFLGITLAVFMIMHLVPGGPIERQIMSFQMALAEEGGGGGGALRMDTAIPEEALEEMRRYYGFDKPVHIRYAQWLWNVVQLDLGRSYIYQDPVWEVIKSRFPVSIFLGLTGFLLSYLVCVPLGVFKAIRHGSRFDFTSSFMVFLGYSIPGWALGTALLGPLSPRRLPTHQLGIPQFRPKNRRPTPSHVPSRGLLYDWLLRHPHHPDQELADGEPGTGLRPDRLCQGPE